jgi:hypothetical protein
MPLTPELFDKVLNQIFIWIYKLLYAIAFGSW